jgi:phage gp36-like protein
MGNYVEIEDVQAVLTAEELNRVADFDGDTAPDETVTDAAIEAAEGEFDSYAGRQVDVPLTTVPAMVKAVVLRLVIYRLYAGRNSVTEGMQKQYEQDLDWMRDVAGGKATLGGASSASSAAGAPAAAKSQANERLFTRETLKDL